MNALKVIFGLIMVFLLAVSVSGVNEFGKVTQGGKLLITDVDVKVGSKSDKNMDYGDRIKNEAKPGDKVSFSIEIKNNFTRDEDLNIEDIEVLVTIEGIDDDDDLDQEDEISKIRADKDDKVSIDFEIPLKVDEDTYEVLIEVEGDDENGTTHAVEFQLELEVEKENNEVRFLRNTLTPSEIKCGRNVQLSTAVINTGSNDEDDVLLEITNSQLGISFRETFDLSEDPFDDDSEFRKNFNIVLPENVAAGVYSVESRVVFDDGSDSKTSNADLVIRQCEILQDNQNEKNKVDDTNKKDENVIVNLPPQPNNNIVDAGLVTAPTLPKTEEKSLFQSSGFLIALITGEVLLVIIAIFIVVAVMRGRRQ
jgi:hypothetical protein